MCGVPELLGSALPGPTLSSRSDPGHGRRIVMGDLRAALHEIVAASSPLWDGRSHCDARSYASRLPRPQTRRGRGRWPSRPQRSRRLQSPWHDFARRSSNAASGRACASGRFLQTDLPTVRGETRIPSLSRSSSAMRASPQIESRVFTSLSETDQIPHWRSGHHPRGNR